MAASLVARKQAFLHHLRGKQNYQVLFFIVQTSDRIYVIFALFKLTYKSAVFYRIIIEYKLTSSGQSAITMYVVCRVIMGFEQKLSKKSCFHSISKMTRPTSHFGILLSAKLAV